MPKDNVLPLYGQHTSESQQETSNNPLLPSPPHRNCNQQQPQQQQQQQEHPWRCHDYHHHHHNQHNHHGHSESQEQHHHVSESYPEEGEFHPDHPENPDINDDHQTFKHHQNNHHQGLEDRVLHANTPSPNNYHQGLEDTVLHANTPSPNSHHQGLEDRVLHANTPPRNSHRLKDLINQAQCHESLKNVPQKPRRNCKRLRNEVPFQSAKPRLNRHDLYEFFQQAQNSERQPEVQINSGQDGHRKDEVPHQTQNYGSQPVDDEEKKKKPFKIRQFLDKIFNRSEHHHDESQPDFQKKKNNENQSQNELRIEDLIKEFQTYESQPDFHKKKKSFKNRPSLKDVLLNQSQDIDNNTPDDFKEKSCENGPDLHDFLNRSQNSETPPQKKRPCQNQHHLDDYFSSAHYPKSEPDAEKNGRTYRNRNNSGGGKKGKGRSRGPIHINVNGRVFVLSKSTCIRIPVLQGMISRLKQSQQRKDMLTIRGAAEAQLVDELFFERNPTVFAAVVDYVQNNELHVPPDVCPKLFARDISFWGFDIDEVESCCFSGVVHFLWEQDRLTKFHGFLRPKNYSQAAGGEGEEEAGLPPSSSAAQQFSVPPNKPQAVSAVSRWKTFREQVWKILDEPFTGRIARAYFYIMCLFILASFFAIAVDTVKEFKGKDPTKTVLWIRILSEICTAYLYIDYFLRIVFYPNLRRFCHDIVNITDGLAVLSSIAKMVTELTMTQGDNSTKTWVNAIDSLQLLRILRLLRPMSKVIGFRLIYFTLKCSFHELLLVFMLLMFLTMIFSSLLYYLGDHTSIKSIPHAMWFSLTTMTTVGYGDIVPLKARTKVIGSVVAVFGVILMSMTMPIMVSNFNLLYINAVVGQPSAIKKVHQELEKAHMDPSSSQYGAGSATHNSRKLQPPSTDHDNKPPGDSAGEKEEKPGGKNSCFRSCCRKRRRDGIHPQGNFLSTNIAEKTPYTTRLRNYSPGARGRQGCSGSDADGEFDVGPEGSNHRTIRSYLRTMTHQNKNFLRRRDTTHSSLERIQDKESEEPGSKDEEWTRKQQEQAQEMEHRHRRSKPTISKQGSISSRHHSSERIMSFQTY